MNVFELFASLSLDKSKYESELASAEDSGKKSGVNIGKAMKTVAKATIAGVTAAAGAIGVLVKQSTAAYADYEQLVGGVETLFGAQGMSITEYAQSVGKNLGEVRTEYALLNKAQNIVLENASNAYKTAGLSANEYMETVTSFAAALNSSLGGDTVASAKKADMAITDMADNANKMGTSMEAIQNAYNGFAKQNYTMLDNLKLGFGGTKEEMQRLLDEAGKLSGIKYDISSYADIVDAIHVIQDEMGITGTTAKEAAETISGSLASTKAAWQNLLVGIADDEADMDSLINNLIESASNFGNNIAPRIEQGLAGVGTVIEKLVPQIMNTLPELITNVVPQFIESGKNLILSLVRGIKDGVPQLMEGAMDIINEFIDAIIEIAPELASAGWDILQKLAQGIIKAIPELTAKAVDIVTRLAQGIRENLPEIIATALEIAQSLADTLAENAPILLEAGIDLFMAIVDGLIESLPMLIEQLPVIIDTIANIINDNAPRLLQAGVQMLIAIAKGLVQAIPTLIANIPMIIKTIFDVWSAFNWLDLGKTVVTGIKNGITGLLHLVTDAGKGMGDAIVNAIKNLPETLAGLGKGSITRFINGIGDMIPNLLEKIGYMLLVFLQKIEGFSLFEAGKNLIVGLINGISSMAGTLLKTVGDLIGSVVDKVKGLFGDGEGSITGAATSAASSVANAASAASVTRPASGGAISAASNAQPVQMQTSVNVTLEGDAKRLFKVMQQQAKQEEQVTGNPAFA
jgi:phage-related protein